jgi:hypothetical protein
VHAGRPRLTSRGATSVGADAIGHANTRVDHSTGGGEPDSAASAQRAVAGRLPRTRTWYHRLLLVLVHAHHALRFDVRRRVVSLKKTYSRFMSGFNEPSGANKLKPSFAEVMLIVVVTFAVFALNQLKFKIVQLQFGWSRQVFIVGDWYVKTSKSFTETHILKTLATCEMCQCDPPRQHFAQLGFEMKVPCLGVVYSMRSCGTSLDNATGFPLPDDIDAQCECIFSSMRRAGVRHWDLQSKNVCIGCDGTLALIDFDDRGVIAPVPPDADYHVEYLRAMCVKHLS